jgi:predicted DNA-binding protein (UPF0251 family)/predicted Fe-Mo cluster-binding NifX family protein
VVRPRKCRMVNAAPHVSYFKPRGVPIRQINEIHLTVEGYEALRLADYRKMTHASAAMQMQVSRQTFGRILAQARQTVAKALVCGLALKIHGGDYALADDALPGQEQFSVNPRELSPAGVAAAGGGKPKGLKDDIKETTMAKIAITSEGPQLEDLLDPRFGRAAGFIVVDPETMEHTFIDNGASQAMAQGAGIQAAENIVNAGATALLTGYVGPKAFAALEAVGIRIGQNMENLTVRQAIDRFLQDDVDWADKPNRRGHGR